MAKIKLTKSAVDAAQPQTQAVELRDTLVPGFLCKITPSGRKVFMLQYRTNAGERRKPALGQYGELTVEQARSLAQEWLAQVRRGGDPGAAKAEARKAPTVEELCKKFMEDHSKKRNKPSTRVGYQGVIDRCIIPLLGRKKVHDVKRPDIAGLMEKLSYKQTEANKAFSILRKMFNLAEVWGYRPDGTNPCRHVPMFGALYGRRRTYRFDFSDQHTVPQTLAVGSAATWLCFDSRLVTQAFACMARLGLTRLLRVDGLTKALAWAADHFPLGSTRFLVQADAVNHADQRASYAVYGDGEAFSTALVAAYVTARLLTRSIPPGVHHIEEVIGLEEVLGAYPQHLRLVTSCSSVSSASCSSPMG